MRRTRTNGLGQALRLTRYCPSCYSAVERRAPRCTHCASQRPSEDWGAIDELGDAWLGRTLEEGYRLERRLGTGATSSVYLATAAHLETPVAVKVVDLERALDSDVDRARERVEAELVALSQVDSAHIVDYIDVVALDGKNVGLVTGFVDGKTVSELLAEEPRLAVDVAVDIARQTALGLRHVHEQGVVHRDVKPGNVMVRPLPDGGWFAFVIDFGLARVAGSIEAPDDDFIGTPLYASPEQIQGGEIGPASDVYGLGAMLFHMLTGQPPFPDESPFSVLSCHVRKAPPMLSEVAPHLSAYPELEDLVAAMLRKAPADRPASMDQVARHLQAIYDAAAQRGLAEDSTATLGAEHTDVLVGTATQDLAWPTADRRLHPSFAVDGAGALVRVNDDGGICLEMSEQSGGGVLLWLPEVPPTAVTLEARIALVGLSDGRVMAIDRESGDHACVLRLPSYVSATALSVGGKRGATVVGTDRGHSFVTRSLADGRWQELPEGAPVSATAIDSLGEVVAVGRDNATVTLFDVGGRSLSVPTLQVGQRPLDLAFSADGYLLAVLLPEGQLQVFSSITGERMLRLEEDPSAERVVFRPKDGFTTVSLDADRQEICQRRALG